MGPDDRTHSRQPDKTLFTSNKNKMTQHHDDRVNQRKCIKRFLLCASKVYIFTVNALHSTTPSLEDGTCARRHCNDRSTEQRGIESEVVASIVQTRLVVRLSGLSLKNLCRTMTSCWRPGHSPPRRAPWAQSPNPWWQSKPAVHSSTHQLSFFSHFNCELRVLPLRRPHHHTKETGTLNWRFTTLNIYRTA